MNIVIFGANGTAGGEAVREAAADDDFEKIFAVSRRPLEFSHEKVTVVRHTDFLDFTSLQRVFRQSQACLWCLGVSQSQVEESEYIRITHDFTLAAAQACLAVNPAITFVFLSGAGADPEEQASTLFGRIKGRTEKHLQELPFASLYIVRPAGIEPVHLNKRTALVNKLTAPFYPILKVLMPSMVISSKVLARAMLSIAKNKPSQRLFGNSDLTYQGQIQP